MPQKKRPRHEELVEDGPLDAARMRRGVPLHLAFGLSCYMFALVCSGLLMQKEKELQDCEYVSPSPRHRPKRPKGASLLHVAIWMHCHMCALACSGTQMPKECVMVEEKDDLAKAAYLKKALKEHGHKFWRKGGGL